jgi:hypothetical protein
VIPKSHSRRGPVIISLTAALCTLLLPARSAGSEPDGLAAFRKDIRPVLKEYCYDCHGDGASKGNVTLDEFASDAAVLENHELWLKVLKNVRAGLMPPPKKPQPAAAQKDHIVTWVKSAVFQADPNDPDPGRVTIRRLNRVEYRNTVRDLLGVDFDTDKAFPPDDSSHGFDNIGDALTLSPMLLEKYLAAAKAVVAQAVPVVPKVPAEIVIPGENFTGAPPPENAMNRGPAGRSLTLSYYTIAFATNRFKAPHTGKYRLIIDGAANERFVDNQFDYNKCRLVLRVDGQEIHSQEYSREGGKALHYEYEHELAAGEHDFVFEVTPLTPDQRQVRSLTLRLDSVTVRGPLEKEHWVSPKNYARFFPRDVPADDAARRAYARELLDQFLFRAWRGPVEKDRLDGLVAIAEKTWSLSGKTFEAAISQAMVAALASPRFLFREESVDETAAGKYPFVDEFALASRLSYLLWSSMPDDELLRLAGEHQLRAQLPAQMKRMLADSRASAFSRNFVGQWLLTRDVDTVSIDARQVLARENTPDLAQERRLERFRYLRDNEDTLGPEEKKELADFRANRNRRAGQPLRAELNADIRRAMRLETEKTFEHILHSNRSLLELLDSDYTFLNEKLARHYGLTNINVAGDEMRLVQLPPETGRGGVLTHGSVLTVTSNPTRTSPVKRGLFILDNLLGTPPAPPPPDITPLEDAAKAIRDRPVSLRETLALHREQPLCASCHNRMDPLGLALENFNALGLWRNEERGLPIDSTGTLLSGESFTNITQLKRILATNHATEFYRTVTEKLLTYALGRGMEYSDVITVDAIVEKLAASGGKPSVLLAEVIQSAPFQKTRSPKSEPDLTKTSAGSQRAAVDSISGMIHRTTQ